MVIRQANLEDLIEVEKTHKKCFPNNFSSLLAGKWHLLAKFYKEYLTVNPDLFLVAQEDNKEIVGFCMGYLCTKKHFKKDFLRHNFFHIAFKYLFLLMTFKRKAWGMLFKRFYKKVHVSFANEPIGISPINTGDLLSICVLDEYKGKGLSTSLVVAYLGSLKKHNIQFCKLSVDDSNYRAIHFYEKCGFYKYLKTVKRETIYLKEMH